MKFLEKFKKKKTNISIFHEFHKPPYGGGNQFLLALKKGFEQKGYEVLNNEVNSGTIACLFNSFNFDFKRIHNVKKENPKVKMIHRVDGPVSSYRGFDDGTDKKIWEVNNEIADATIFQSQYSLDKHIELGFTFDNVTIIHNSVDGSVFNFNDRINPPNENRKIKLIAASWSDNDNKGGPLYKQIENKLDFNKYEFTFLGRTKQEFSKIKLIDPVPSEEVAKIFKEHDVYITASQNDPCSNSLLEALSCGLPAVFLNSGGHPELVGLAGVPFNSEEEVLKAIDKVSKHYIKYQSLINVMPMEEVVNKYLEIIL